MPLVKILVTPQTQFWNSETEKFDQFWTMEQIGKFIQIESMIAIALSLIVFFGVVFVGRRNKRKGSRAEESKNQNVNIFIMKIIKWFLKFFAYFFLLLVFIIFVSICLSVLNIFRNLPFEPSQIKSVTFYCVDPFDLMDYEGYLTYIEPYSYKLSLEEAQLLFKETQGNIHTGWKGGRFLGVVELENGKRYDMAMGMMSDYKVLHKGLYMRFSGESAALYEELSGKLYKDCRPLLESKGCLAQIKSNLEILEKGGEYSLEELFGNEKESLEINRQLSKIFQTSTKENGGIIFYTSAIPVKDGLLCDAYETPFLFTCESNEWASKVNPLMKPMSENFFVWSSGKNQSNEFGFGDDIFFPKTRFEPFVIRPNR
jgi:hypothetical protein